jgi:hypothetical protein
MSSHRDGFRPSTSGWSFHGRDRSPDLEIDPHREITTIDVERDLYVLRVEDGRDGSRKRQTSPPAGMRRGVATTFETNSANDFYTQRPSA